MGVLTTILLTLLIFGLLVLIHETGHYIAARAFRIGVREFSIGFGPKLYQKKGKYNLFSIRAIPMGGYVSMIGETEEVEDEAEKSIAFRSKPIWQRLIVALSGSIMNILAGLIVLAILVASQKSYATTTIGAFTEDAVSNYQGLEVGDKIIKLNGKNIDSANDLFFLLQIDGIEPLDVTVLRDGEKKSFSIQFNTISASGVLLASPDFKVQSVQRTFGRAISEIYHQSISNVKMIYRLIGETLKGRFGIEGVSGPIGIGEVVGEAKASSTPVRSLSSLFVTIALNLGIFNLLPIPMLDGGMIMFLIYEAIFRRRVPEKVEAAITMFFMVILILFAIFIAFKDTINLFS
ncbi:MAG: M50 family metallopeptidase [Eubacteriales bacterium]|nr:M50 family metallopeptidase [Eubacteriales bacterium]MDD4474586.1 M50 family metallopeptidase [Eubacteriales bacterium]